MEKIKDKATGKYIYQLKTKEGVVVLTQAEYLILSFVEDIKKELEELKQVI